MKEKSLLDSYVDFVNSLKSVAESPVTTQSQEDLKKFLDEFKDKQGSVESNIDYIKSFQPFPRQK